MKVQTLVYGVFVLVVIVLGAMVVILRNQIETKELELKVAGDTIKEQAAALSRITAQRKVDDRIVTELTKGLAELKAATEAQTTAISELEASDPNVKNFLSLPLPDSLKLLLGGKNSASGSGNTIPAR